MLRIGPPRVCVVSSSFLLVGSEQGPPTSTGKASTVQTIVLTQGDPTIDIGLTTGMMPCVEGNASRMNSDLCCDFEQAYLLIPSSHSF